MKKCILLMSMALIGAGNSFAQRIKVGPEIGVNWSKFNADDPTVDDDDFRMRAGLKVGGIVDIGFDRMFSFQPGLYFNQKGARDKFSVPVPGGREYSNNKIRVNYLEIPLNFQLKFGRPYRGQFFIGAGPYFAFAISGDVDIKRTVRYDNGTSVVLADDDYDLEIGNNERDDDIKGSDAGINLNLGFMAPRGFFIRGNSGIGLANVLPGGNNDYSWRNFSLSLTAGFLFGH